MDGNAGRCSLWGGIEGKARPEPFGFAQDKLRRRACPEPSRRVLQLFADLLDYPAAGLAEKVNECEKLVSSVLLEAAPLVRTFRAFVEETAPGRLEEVYTGFFDLNPVCHPYIGYHLFGETYKRSSFLLALKERYREAGFDPDKTELPDRLSVMLRFLGINQDCEQNREMIVEGVLPALDHILSQGKEAAEPVAPGLQCNDTQLEGHSQGEVLSGGFVLAMTEEAYEEGANQIAEHPYRQALLALRMVLEFIAKAQGGSYASPESKGMSS